MDKSYSESRRYLSGIGVTLLQQAKPPAENRSISSLLSDLTQEVTTLMRQELQLAKAELFEKVSQVETGIGALAVGAALAFGGFIILLHAGIYGIADLLSETFNVPQLWIASLIVGGGFLIIGLAVLKHVTHRARGKMKMEKATNVIYKKPLVMVSLGIVFVILALYFFWPSFHEAVNQAFTILVSGDRKGLQEFFKQFGFLGPLVIILAMVAQMFLIVIPSTALLVVSILAYGPFWGSFIALLAVLVASTVGYLIGRKLGPITVDKLIGLKTRKKTEQYVERYGFWAVIVARFSPFLSNDAISFVGGLLRMNYWRFMGATFIGILPLGVIIAYLGETNERLKTGLIWISVVSLIAFIAYVIYDHHQQRTRSQV